MTAETQRKIDKLKWLYHQAKTQKMMKEKQELLEWYKNAYNRVSDDFGKLVVEELF